ncbi:hypothetical protein E9531_17265 [Lampropedia puyangensis]|uniref:Uncharacterized protein n=2 Tax=Lampropedia puyangensis TaxID=1330072 RepID=A0A4S8EL12_9BURK|nr:hypothetical protein E9531_17265 [Lampropedia puyangensis]
MKPPIPLRRTGSAQPWRLLMVTLLCLACHGTIQASVETAIEAEPADVEGFLQEVGQDYSTIVYMGGETGDVVGYVFENHSAAGQLILQRCMPNMLCIVDHTELVEFSPSEMPQLPVVEGASAMFWIQSAQTADASTAFSLDSTTLSTRFGTLAIDASQQLTFNTRPVLATVEAPVEVLSREQYEQENLSFIERWIKRISRFVFGDEPDDALAIERRTRSIGVAKEETVQGNARLRIVQHFENERDDWVLVMNTGDQACPAMFRLVTLNGNGATSTPEFGSCSELVQFEWLGDKDLPAKQVLSLVMPEWNLAEAAPQRSPSGTPQMKRYVFEHGRIRDSLQ